jgi:hypothetical protein
MSLFVLLSYSVTIYPVSDLKGLEILYKINAMQSTFIGNRTFYYSKKNNAGVCNCLFIGDNYQ